MNRYGRDFFLNIAPHVICLKICMLLCDTDHNNVHDCNFEDTAHFNEYLECSLRAGVKQAHFCERMLNTSAMWDLKSLPASYGDCLQGNHIIAFPQLQPYHCSLAAQNRRQVAWPKSKEFLLSFHTALILTDISDSSPFKSFFAKWSSYFMPTYALTVLSSFAYISSPIYLLFTSPSHTIPHDLLSPNVYGQQILFSLWIILRPNSYSFIPSYSFLLSS